MMIIYVCKLRKGNIVGCGGEYVLVPSAEYTKSGAAVVADLADLVGHPGYLPRYWSARRRTSSIMSALGHATV